VHPSVQSCIKNPSRSMLLLTHDATLSSQGPSILTDLMRRRDSHRRELTSSLQHSHLRGVHACFYVNCRASWVLELPGRKDLSRGAPRRLKREQRQMEPPLGVIGRRPRSQPPPCWIRSPRRGGDDEYTLSILAVAVGQEPQSRQCPGLCPLRRSLEKARSGLPNEELQGGAWGKLREKEEWWSGDHHY
jgi:hypothetical protein